MYIKCASMSLDTQHRENFFNFCYFLVEDRKMCQLEREEEKKGRFLVIPGFAH